MAFLKILAFISLIGSIAWTIAAPGYEPALAIVASAAGLISLFVVERKRKRDTYQRQSVSQSSLGIQAGGDVNIGGAGNDKHA